MNVDADAARGSVMRMAGVTQQNESITQCATKRRGECIFVCRNVHPCFIGTGPMGHGAGMVVALRPRDIARGCDVW